MKQLCLIGKKLSHSSSADYFKNKFKKEGVDDYSYHLEELASITELKAFIANRPELIGFNVTIPYKQRIIPYIQHLDFKAKKADAVNTVYIARKNGKIELYGYNTDIIGFKKSIRPFLASEHDRALILGTGGASKAVAVVLEELGIPFLKVSRNPQKNEIAYTDLNEFVMRSHHLIINTTPVGTYPEVEEFPAIPYSMLNERHFLYDLVYNPEETVFLQKGKEQNCLILNGRSMLEFQADAAWEIWKNHESKN